jgi:beta-aspartyl-peptidase (threonine type)
MSILTLVFSAALLAPPAIVVHGGAGSPRSMSDGTLVAASKGLDALRAGRAALDGAIAAVVSLEDDCRYNAGTGANIRLDGKTIQMDAAVMDGAGGRFGAVAAIERVKNPVLVARRVLDTPHLLIVGEGATRLARTFGFPDYDPTCSENRARYEKLVKALASGDKSDPRWAAWARLDWLAAWNFPGPPPKELTALAGHADTVGAVARDSTGHFAAAISTGGTAITFYGRVGDVPVYGAGIYAGPAGAVACTGTGEEIVRHLVSKAVYDDLARGTGAQAAVERALAAFPKDVDLGIVAVSADGEGGGCNYSAERKTFDTKYRDNMAWTALRAP